MNPDPTLDDFLRSIPGRSMLVVGRYTGNLLQELHLQFEIDEEHLILRGKIRDYYIPRAQLIFYEALETGGGFVITDSHNVKHKLIPYALLPLA